ncbi:hypothetical protein [Sphingobacterium kitahiroshimense]|uniref:DUF3857 domain-containing protein n=1 Tax=Sphingobacterium kitahiroshimense TaxID=470446 RepID=A0ABV0C1A3_9SPHI
MITAYMKYYQILLLMLVCSFTARSQQLTTSPLDSTLLYPKQYGTFENYEFILNGARIEKEELLKYPEATFGGVFDYSGVSKSKYQGVLYLHTPWYPPSPAYQYADDPAYFINNIQVSPYAIRSTLVEEYTAIRRSEQDTLIDGIVYQGSIHVETDEDFFSSRMTISEIVKKYTDLPLKNVTVHWRSRYWEPSDPGVIIQDHFPLYYINPKGLLEVKVDRIRFAEGERYFVHLVDQGYRYSNLTRKGWRTPQKNFVVFYHPRDFDPKAPCYIADFDIAGKDIRSRAQGEPEPSLGEAAYLKKLSAYMGLSADQSQAETTRDSIMVQFIVLYEGQITGLESSSPQKPVHAKFLQAIKQHSCVWTAAWENRKTLLFRRKMAIFYNKDKKGNIRSLDRLEYRYDDEPNTIR